MLANTRREIWFIPQRHVRAWKLLDGDEMFIKKMQNDECRMQNERQERLNPSRL
jgi:hypothetical protein